MRIEEMRKEKLRRLFFICVKVFFCPVRREEAFLLPKI